MKTHTRKKVIIITTVVIITALSVAILKRPQPDALKEDNSAFQYIGRQNINLPNGSISTLEIATTQDLQQGWIGVSLSDLTPVIKDHLHYVDQYGVYVQDTMRDSPAQVAGILPGDIITKINASDTQEVFNTLKMIAALQPGSSYAFTVFRQGTYLNYTVTPRQHFS